MINLNPIKDEIALVMNEYRKNLDLGLDNHEICKEIRAIIQKSFIIIKDYAVANPITQGDLVIIQKFIDDMQPIDKIIHNIGLSKINCLVEKFSLIGMDKAYFQTEATVAQKVKLLLEKFKNFFVGAIKDKINQQFYTTWKKKLIFEARKENIKKLQKKIEKLKIQAANNPNSKKVQRKLAEAEGQIIQIKMKVAKYEAKMAKGKATREQLVRIGGTRVALETKDHVILDGTYLSAQQFHKKCVEAGAETIKLQVPIEKEKSAEIVGMVFPKDKSEQFLFDLHKLKLLGAGWMQIDMGNQVAIIPDFEAKHLLEKKLIKIEEKGNGFFVDNIINKVKIDQSPLEFNPDQSGTAILGIGRGHVYEMYKREALSLLMQGVNVMLFNHRGHGESTGKPSEKGTYEDMETVYQYLKQVHHIEDEKLIVRGMCLSGGIVSQLAANHPVNVILDQTYADIKSISLKVILQDLKKILHYRTSKKNNVKKAIIAMLTPLLRQVAALISPAYSTVKHLKKIEGKILVLRLTEDKTMDKTVSDQIINTYAKHVSSDKVYNMRVGHMPGEHGKSWLDAKTYKEEMNLGKYHMLSFLKENGISNSFIDKGKTLEALVKDYNSYLSNPKEAEDFEKQKLHTFRIFRNQE